MEKIILLIKKAYQVSVLQKWFSAVSIITIGTICFYTSCAPNMDLGPDFGAPECFCIFPYPNFITIYNNKFQHDTLVIKYGTTVTWDNWDSYEHSLISPNDPDFRSGNIPALSTFSYTFKNTGNFKYHCTVHSEAGVIIVTP